MAPRDHRAAYMAAAALVCNAAKYGFQPREINHINCESLTVGMQMITTAEIHSAQARVADYVRRTPVLELEAGALFEGGICSLKLEHFQHTGSFKVRGAFNALLSSERPAGGVAAYSGGNHGAAVAYAATSLGLKSTIFVPDFAGPVKIGRMQNFGADVRVMDAPAAEIVAAFQRFARDNNALAVHPYDDALVLAGQGTLGLEMEEQLAGVDTVVLSVGGGGLLGGIGSWFGDRVNIIAVESEGTATLATALEKGIGSEITPTGVAASALGAGSMGVMPMEVVANTRTQSFTVSDQAIVEAQKRLWDRTRVVGEPGAATALAVLTSGAYVPEKDERVCV
ncbi:MAG: serine/threonine dehydratase, partial [Paracoccaceae bacterium]